MCDAITFPFGVEGVGGNRSTDATTITKLNHPVMSGRFGSVDNAGNVFEPRAPGGFNPSPAQVLATTVNAEGAILALETESGRAVFFNDISFISDDLLFDGAGNLPAIMNAFLYVFNLPIFEGVKQGAVLIPKDGIATISTSPTMPPLTAQLTNANGNDSVEWRLKVEYTEGNRSGDPPSLYPGPAETDFVTLAGNVAWNIGSAFGSDFVGGVATLTYKLDGGPEIQFPFEIQGLNPPQATVRDELPSLRHHLIAWKEGRFQQFQTLADFTATWMEGPLSVLRSGDNGFGIMQLTSGTIPKNQLWNWKDNVNEGESRADAFTASALIYNDQVQQGLPWDSDTGFEPPGPPDEGVAFPNATEFTQDELDLETWARYNSGLRYHNWQDDPPMWIRRPTNLPDEESPLGYADELADFRDDIVNNSVFPPLWN